MGELNVYLGERRKCHLFRPRFLAMKTFFTLVSVTLLLILTVSIWPKMRPLAAPVPPQPAPTVVAPAAPTVRTLARSSEAGHVADVMVWSNGRVVKGQLLARISIPVSTPALRLAQQAFARAAAAYEAQPNAESYQALEQARIQLASVPRFERNGYVVAPATGCLVKSLLVNGQYLPRAGAVAIIEVPVAGKTAAPVVLAAR